MTMRLFRNRCPVTPITSLENAFGGLETQLRRTRARRDHPG
jgi:hypothetical protein